MPALEQVLSLVARAETPQQGLQAVQPERCRLAMLVAAQISSLTALIAMLVLVVLTVWFVGDGMLGAAATGAPTAPQTGKP